MRFLDVALTAVSLGLAGFSAAQALPAPASPPAPKFDEASAARFAKLALDCVGREYPNKISHVMQSAADARLPHELTPSFFGCYDWHSSVHGHWLLARLLRTFPAADWSGAARAALERDLAPERIAGEVAYLEGLGRVSFERPYGLAWLLQLAAELSEWDDPDAGRWSQALRPLEAAAARRLAAWLPKLTRPVRIGEHDQTAFALGLATDWARRAGDRASERLFEARSREFFLADRACPIAYEPSGEDFLSPCLAEADLMRRFLAPAPYAEWLSRFLPGIPRRAALEWLAPAVVSDPSDPKLAHLDGLNLSRAWMLEGIASALSPSDPRLPAIRAAARRHREAGLAAVTGAHYEGGHWLGSFAVYLVTGRGLSPLPASEAGSPPEAKPSSRRSRVRGPGRAAATPPA
jgi:hypothetical protein